MPAVLNLSNFTFTAEQIRDINELIFDEILHAPAFDFLHQFYSGIEYDREIGFINEGGLVGKAAQGCNPTAQDWNIGTRKVVWTPKAWEIIIDNCAKDIEGTMAVYCQNKGVQRNDLTNTDYMAIVVSVLAEAIKKMIYRIVWFSDSQAKNQSASGFITNGVDADYFTIIPDGFFKQLQTATTKHKELLVTIPANAKATKKEQMDGMTGDEAFKILESMYYAAPITMRMSGNMRFLVTQSIADGYQKYLTTQKLEASYHNLVDGIKALTFLGVDVVPVPIWDEMIQSYHDLGTKFHYPHRAVLIEKANLAIGTPSEGVLENVDCFYDKLSRTNRLEASDKIDAKLLDDTRFVYAQ